MPHHNTMWLVPNFNICIKTLTFVTWPTWCDVIGWKDVNTCVKTLTFVTWPTWCDVIGSSPVQCDVIGCKHTSMKHPECTDTWKESSLRLTNPPLVLLGARQKSGLDKVKLLNWSLPYWGSSVFCETAGVAVLRHFTAYASELAGRPFWQNTFTELQLWLSLSLFFSLAKSSAQNIQLAGAHQLKWQTAVAAGHISPR